MNPTVIEKFIGDKKFYKMVLAISVPILIQNGITNFVNLLDNIMVGQLGTEAMSGAAIVNQLFFIYNLCIFGCVAGAGIFTAQYYGQSNQEGIRYTFRYKLWFAAGITIAAIVGTVFCGDHMVAWYLQGEGSPEEIVATLRYGREYLNIILVGLPPFMMTQIYASTLRECGITVIPMKAGLAATLVNLAGNYILIYGKLGAPALGVAGAAIATVIARYIEAAIVIVWTHKHSETNPYIVGMYRTLTVPLDVAKKVFVKGTPLMLNEMIWGFGTALVVQSYSVRGLNVVAAVNIAQTINNLFSIAYMALGDSVAIIVGQRLGADKLEEAKDVDNKMIAFTTVCGVAVAVAIALFAPIFPQFYKTSTEVREIARNLIWMIALFMPMQAYLYSAYYTLRSGGKTLLTFFVDSGLLWLVRVPLAIFLTRFTSLPIVTVFFILQLADLVKAVMMGVMVKKNVWLHNIVGK